MTMTTTQAMMALTVGVEEEVEHMFGDMIATGQGIGTSDLGACWDAIYDTHTAIIQHLIAEAGLTFTMIYDMMYAEIERLEEYYGCSIEIGY